MDDLSGAPNSVGVFRRATGPPARIKMTALEEKVENGSSTLGQRLAEGPLPLPEMLRHARMLAEALRGIHDSGRACGALLPSNIVVATTGLELIQTPGQAAAITPTPPLKFCKATPRTPAAISSRSAPSY